MLRKNLSMSLVKKLLLGFCLVSCLLVSVPNHVLAVEIFRDLDGAELLKQVAIEYAPDSTLGYRRGRDVMYSQIDNHDGVVRGIYTGYSINLDPNSSSPRRDAYEQNINAEHIYPQSKGARGSAKSDLHSLFPARERVNSERSNNPFGEINDSLTRRWFINAEELRSIPTESIDEYSESLTGQLFEPRESKKGDVARGMFYFYTVYRFLADENDPNFFPRQREALCQWNTADPVDDAEIARSAAIAEFQGNENPFIIDSQLASRTYCQ